MYREGGVSLVGVTYLAILSLLCVSIKRAYDFFFPSSFLLIDCIFFTFFSSFFSFLQCFFSAFGIILFVSGEKGKWLL